MVITQLKRSIQQSSQINFFTNDLIRCRRFAFLNEIAPAKLFRSQSNCGGNFIHVALEREYALRCSETPERAVGWHVRRHRRTPDANIWAEIWTGGVNCPARKNHRRERAIRA